MATVVRVKRRRHEDVADILVLSCKRRKSDDRDAEPSHQQQSDHLTGVLKFAGTVSSKTDAVSSTVKSAIRKEKLEREYKQHQLNILGEIRQQTRRRQKQSSQKNRFTITAKHRAPYLDSLDQIDPRSGETVESRVQAQTQPESVINLNSTDHSVTDAGKVVNDLGKPCSCRETSESCSNVCNCKVQSDGEVRTNGTCNTAGTCGKPSAHENIVSVTGSSDKHNDCTESDTASPNVACEKVCSADGSGDGMYCLVDMEADTTPTYESLINSNDITCNSVPMIRERVPEPDQTDFVYDLYYTNSRDFDFRLLENVLSVEACGERLVHDGEMSDDDDGAGYEDEDSNDEGNWRNDYPDRDPGFIDNCDAEYYYGEDMADNAGFEDDTGNQLADWVSWHCNIESKELSSDDDIQQYKGAGGTSIGDYHGYVGDVEKGSVEKGSEDDTHSDTND